MASAKEDKAVQAEIEKTLVSINSTILEIRRELKAVADLVNSDSELHSSVMSTMEKLTEKAESLGIDTNAINSSDESLFRISTEPIDAVDKLLSSTNQ